MRMFKLMAGCLSTVFVGATLLAQQPPQAQPPQTQPKPGQVLPGQSTQGQNNQGQTGQTKPNSESLWLANNTFKGFIQGDGLCQNLKHLQTLSM